MRVFEVDPAGEGNLEDATRAAAVALREGKPVVFPTETVYGIAARPDAAVATDRLFAAKRRPGRLALPVLAPNTEVAFDLCRPDPRARRLASRFWPGPLTIVLPRNDRTREWRLGGEPETIGVRVPDHPVALALLAAAGVLAVTSANISGRPPLEDAAALIDAFGKQIGVYLILPEGARPPGGRASTVVNLTGAGVRILRPGPIEERAILSVMEGPPPLGQSVDSTR